MFRAPPVLALFTEGRESSQAGRGPLPCRLKPAGCCFSDRCFWGTSVCRCPLPGPFIYRSSLTISYLSSEPLPAAASHRAGRWRLARGARNGRWGAVAGPPCQTRPEAGGAAARGPGPPLLAAFSPRRGSPSASSRRGSSRRRHAGLRGAGGAAGEEEPADGRAARPQGDGRSELLYPVLLRCLGTVFLSS